MTTTTTVDLRALAAQAYVYGFPLVTSVDQIRRSTTVGFGRQPGSPFNQFSHVRALAGPAEGFVSVNNDTVYSFAQLDLSGGPVLLELPDTGNRYYVMQFVSAWTENFAYVGKRATGTAAQRHLIVGPEWQDQAADKLEHASVIRSPTTVCTVVGRWAVADEADLAEVARLQAGTTLTPLHSSTRRGLPEVSTSTTDAALAFWEKYRVYSQAFAPPRRDWELQNTFAPLGLTAQTPVTELADEVRAALVEGHADAVKMLEQVLRTGRSASAAGWSDTLHAFDYNLDHFEIGALDESRWKIADPDVRLFTRAGAALGGLWGCHAYEAAYFTAYVDDAGERLTGEHRYELTLDPPPPHGAFWSVTMYDDQDYFLVPNPIDRYSVGDRTPGLVTSPDGAVTIVISHDEPHDGRANWLPAPAGGFRPMLRVYQPGDAVTTGDYVVPPIRRVR